MTNAKKQQNAKRGITLISLVITIILLLILATVAISLAVDSDGLFGKAGDATNKWNTSIATEEEMFMEINEIFNGVKEGESEEPEAPVLVAGLYETGTYNLIKDWETLKSEGYIDSQAAAEGGLRATTYIEGDLVVDDEITAMWPLAFTNCSSLTSIILPDSITNIGPMAFTNCSSLKSIIIPDSVTTIDRSAFTNCTNLKSVKMGKSVTSIYAGAFAGCSSLVSIILPDSVTNIGSSAFLDCTTLTDITIGDNIVSIGPSVFENTGWYNAQEEGFVYLKDKYLIKYKGTMPSNTTLELAEGTIVAEDAFSGCSGLTSITLPDSVTSIGYCTFYNCSGLTNITFPSNLTSIGMSAFEGCSSLKSITIPDGVTIIDSNAFYGCSNLESITLPDDLTTIGQSAFSNCSSLKSIIIPDSVTDIYIGPFTGCSNLTIYCEAASKPEGWNTSWNYSNCPVVWGYKT